MTTTSRGRRNKAQSKGDRNEQAIIDAAERLLQRQSINEISTEALARGAGISRPGFYFYFGSKQDVLLSLMDRLVDEQDAVIETLRETVADNPLAALATAIRASAQVWRKQGHMLHAVLEAADSSPRIRALWQSRMDRFVGVIAETITAERDRGAAPDVGPSAKELAGALVWAHERTFQQSTQDDPAALVREEIIVVLVELFYRTLYAEPAAQLASVGNRTPTKR